MSFDGLMSDTIDIYRAQAGPGVVTSYGDTPYNPGVPCLIQPVQGEFISKTDMNYGRPYTCLVAMETDLNLSDRVIDENGKTYQVTGSLNRDYGSPAVQHLTFMLTEEASQGPDD